MNFTNVTEEYPDYLRDESRRVGHAISIAFPQSEADVRDLLRQANEQKELVTIQGSRTGITGGAVPMGGHILNLSRMNRILGLRRGPSQDEYRISVQPGVILADLRKALPGLLREAGEPRDFFFPPDPTEASASIGGMIACNASGACSYHYGPTRRYICGLQVVLMDGSKIHLQRDAERTSDLFFRLTTDRGRNLEASLPSYRMPTAKNAAGYYSKAGMDLIELMIGSEGTLGVITEAELQLIPQPKAIWGLMAFFPDERAALDFVHGIRQSESAPVAIEYFDAHALALLRKQKAENPAFSELPELPAGNPTGVYLEFHGQSESEVESKLSLASDVLTRCGGPDAATWLADDARSLERMKYFRHALPECVNLTIDQRRKIDPRLTKLGTDLSVPDAWLDAVVKMYRMDLEGSGLEFVMFGHIGDNHIHVNILPNNQEEYERGRSLYARWAKTVVDMGGSVSAEHGIGKLKTAMLLSMYGEDGIQQMRAVKAAFDPLGLLNRGNLFDPGEATT